MHIIVMLIYYFNMRNALIDKGDNFDTLTHVIPIWKY
jgi:hypothetical protein